jgi:hypothetical protein
MIGGINTPLLSGITTGNKKLGVNTNPLNLTYTFEVNSPISNSVKINSNTNSTNLELMNSDGSVFIKSSNKNMTLQTDTTALVYLKGDVNRVGILTMNPEQALEVAGTIRVDSLGSNTLTPTKLVGANDANDLSDVKLGTGLFISNDTLKLNDNIINLGDTATLLRDDYYSITTNKLVWTEGNKKLIPYFTQVYRNGQLLKLDEQYIFSGINNDTITLEEGSYKLGDNITIIAIDNIVALAGSGGVITLQGDVTGYGTSSITTTIGTGKVTNTMLAGSISNNKLDVITTAGKVSNSATTATSNNTNNAIVSRDASGDFSAGIITASLNGNANTATNVAYSGLTGTVPTWNQNTTGNAATVTTNANLNGDITSVGNTTTIASGVIVNADINNSAAIAVSKLAASTISGITLGNNLNTLTISSPLTGTSYNGSNAVSIGLQAATTLVAGSMSAADKTKLDGIAAGAQVNVATNLAQGTRTTTTVPITSSTGTSATLDIATTTLAGVMSSADKTKLDGIASGATANTGTVTSVSGTGTVSGLTLTGTVTSNGNLTLGGTLSLTSGNVTSALGFTPYNATNPNSYITSSALSPYATLASPTFTGTVSGITKTMVGLSDVDNTTDLNKPISTATQTALNLKQNTLTNPVTGTGTINYIPKFTATGSTIGNSTLIDNGTTISTASTLSTTNYASFNSTQVMSTTSGLLSTHRFTSANANGVYDKDYFLTSYMGAPWQGSDPGSGNRSKPPIVAIINNNDPSFINSGLHLMTTNSTNNTYTPAITFGVNSENGSYYNTIGAITAKKLNTGQFTSQSAGQLEFFGTGTSADVTGASMTTANMTVGVGVGIGYTTAPTVRGRLIVSERIGINQSTPNFTLDVGGTLNTTGAATINNVLTINSGASNGLLLNGTNSQFIKVYSSDSGFGNAGTWYQNATTGQTEGTDGLFVGIVGGTGSYFTNYENSRTYFRTFSNSNQLVLDTDGNVGIGVEDATNKLDINGTLRVRTTNTVTPTTILGRDNTGVVGGIVVGSGLTLSGSTLSLTSSSGGFITTNNDYTVTITDTWIVFNNNFNNITVTLPDATTSTGRTLYFRNAAAGSIVSAGTANIINNNVTTGPRTNDILGAGNTSVKWCTLVSNGTYWIKMQAGSL